MKNNDKTPLDENQQVTEDAFLEDLSIDAKSLLLEEFIRQVFESDDTKYDKQGERLSIKDIKNVRPGVRVNL